MSCPSPSHPPLPRPTCCPHPPPPAATHLLTPVFLRQTAATVSCPRCTTATPTGCGCPLWRFFFFCVCMKNVSHSFMVLLPFPSPLPCCRILSSNLALKEYNLVLFYGSKVVRKKEYIYIYIYLSKLTSSSITYVHFTYTTVTLMNFFHLCFLVLLLLLVLFFFHLQIHNYLLAGKRWSELRLAFLFFFLFLCTAAFYTSRPTSDSYFLT